MTTRRNACSIATGARHWKKCFSTWRAGEGSSARPRNDRQRQRPRFFHQPRERHAASLLVSRAIVLARPPRPDVLADGADGGVAFVAALRVAEQRTVRSRRRCVHRRGAAVGYLIPRPDRILDFIPGRNVVAQPWQHHDLAAAAG